MASTPSSSRSSRTVRPSRASISASESRSGRPRCWARRAPIVVLPLPMRPTTATCRIGSVALMRHDSPAGPSWPSGDRWRCQTRRRSGPARTWRSVTHRRRSASDRSDGERELRAVAKGPHQIDLLPGRTSTISAPRYRRRNISWPVKWATIQLSEERAHLPGPAGENGVARLGATTAPSHRRKGPPPRQGASECDLSEVW